MTHPHWKLTEADAPMVATAIHAGHQVSPEAESLLALSGDDRLREEDPYTDRWLGMAPTQVDVRQSRFEYDLNRPPETAIYLTPDQAWGLNVWKQPPPQDLLSRSRQSYEAFYLEIGTLLDGLAHRHPRMVVFDLHSYCHRRQGPNAPEADPQANPEVNLGTESVADAQRPLVERFAAELRSFDFEGRSLDVRENVKFKGGNFSRWINQRYGSRVCAIASEFKKTFMDEWTGQPDLARIDLIGQALTTAAFGVEQELADR